MYDKESGMITCEGCGDLIEGYGFFVDEGSQDPSGCHCWECACEVMERLLNANNKEATVVRRSENWIRDCYDLGVTV